MNHDNQCEHAVRVNFLRGECRCLERALAAENAALRKDADRLQRANNKLVQIIRNVHGHLLDDRITAALSPDSTP